MSELRKSKYAAAPSSGARRPAGKHSDKPDANLLFGDKKKPEEVKTLPVESDNEDHYKCMEVQNNGKCHSPPTPYAEFHHDNDLSASQTDLSASFVHRIEGLAQRAGRLGL